MYAVIFEVHPKPERLDEYLDIAGSLRVELEHADGFISIERFASLTEEGKILSLSFWRDKQAVDAWRKNALHRLAQTKGRNELFEDYRLMVADVVRDYGMHERAQAPQNLPPVKPGPAQ